MPSVNDPSPPCKPSVRRLPFRPRKGFWVWGDTSPTRGFSSLRSSEWRGVRRGNVARHRSCRYGQARSRCEGSHGMGGRKADV